MRGLVVRMVVTAKDVAFCVFRCLMVFSRVYKCICINEVAERPVSGSSTRVLHCMVVGTRLNIG